MTEMTRKSLGRTVDTAQMLKLRRDGYPIEHIAGVVNMSPIACLAAINDAVKDLQGDSREYAVQIREMELQRLELATKAIMPNVEAGDHEAIDMLLKVQKRRSSYLGLDAPTNANLNVDTKIEVVLKYSNPAFNQQPDLVTDVTPIEHVTAPPNTVQDIAAAHQSHLDANKAAREHDKAHPKPWLDKPPEPKAAPGVVFRTPPTPGVLANPSGGKPD